MTESNRRKPKLTLKDLQSVSLPDSAPSPAADDHASPADFLASFASAPADAERPAAPSSSTPSALSAGDGPSLDAAEYLPEGVSSDVASLLGRPTRQQAETNAFKKLAEQVAAAEAAAAEERRRREEAEARDLRLAADRELLQKQIAEAALAEQARQARTRRRNRLVGGLVGGTILVLLTAVVTLFALRPPPLDPNVYLQREVALESVVHSGESVVRFDAIPEPEPEPEVVETPRRSGSSSSRSRSRSGSSGRDTVRGRDLF